MHAAIEQIAQEETGEEHKPGLADQEAEDKEKCGGDDQAWHRGHEQPLPVPGVMMVIAVHDIDELLRPGALGDQMKKIAVHDIFEEGPGEHPDKKDHYDGGNGKTESRPAVIQRKTYDRKIH